MRYIDADNLIDNIKLAGLPVISRSVLTECLIPNQPTADVRGNIYAKKVIGGGECDGATCWFECSHCHGTVDILDAYCKHCGAALELENDL